MDGLSNLINSDSNINYDAFQQILEKTAKKLEQFSALQKSYAITRDEINPYLKPEVRFTIGTPSLTKADFIPDRIKEFEEFYCRKTAEKIKTDSSARTEENFKQSDPKFSIAILKPYKKSELEDWLSSYARKVL